MDIFAETQRLGVEWNPEKYSVNVTFPKENKPSINVEQIKTYVWALDYYSALINLGNSFYPLQLIFYSTLSHLQNDFNVISNLENAENALSSLINNYNNLQKQDTMFINSLEFNGINDQYINSTLVNFYDAIDYYKLSLLTLVEYAESKNQIKIDEFFNIMGKAIKENNKGYDSAYAGYSFLYSSIQNIQASSTVHPTNENVPTPVPTNIELDQANNQNIQLPSQTTFDLKLYSNDGKTYLGKLTSNELDIESIFNEFGTYGSKFSITSIWNEFGTYGSQFSVDSAFNKFTSTPPIILLGNDIVGYLTVNSFVNGAISPYGLKEILKELGY